STSRCNDGIYLVVCVGDAAKSAQGIRDIEVPENGSGQLLLRHLVQVVGVEVEAVRIRNRIPVRIEFRQTFEGVAGEGGIQQHTFWCRGAAEGFQGICTQRVHTEVTLVLIQLVLIGKARIENDIAAIISEVGAECYAVVGALAVVFGGGEMGNIKL